MAGPGPGRRYAAVVLAGGTSRRWGGIDKTAADLAGRPVLAHVVQGLPADLPVVVVGPAGHPFADLADPARVRWTREDPPGGGPVAGLAAGLAALRSAGFEDGDDVVLLAGDLPDAGSAVPRLLAALREPAAAEPVDVAVGVDPQGRRQPLLAAYRLAPLRAVLAADAARGLPTGGRAMRELLGRLRVREVPVSAAEAFDLDTPADLDALQVRIRTGTGHRERRPRA
jgi:molybdopterin-guanine dinucleotide biosynthesis protein A